MTAPTSLSSAASVSSVRQIVRAVVLTIPGWAPSKGNSYRIGTTSDGAPRLFKGSPGRVGAAVADFEVATLRAMLENRVVPLDGNLTVQAIVYPPNLRSDVPGVEKLLLDALQNWRWGRGHGSGTRRKIVNAGGYGCYLNDAQVKRFAVDFGGVDKANPRIVVRVTPWIFRGFTA